MNFNASANRFVELVDTKPGLLLRGSRQGLDPETQNVLNEKLKKFKKIFVEFGSGSGGHLIERAAQTPEALFIGFELRYKRVYRTAEKAEKAGLNNILLIQTNAALAPTIFGAATIDGIYILFPDPWDKRRWKKHRLLNEEYLQILHSLLKPGGFLHYKTDHGEYFEATVNVLEKLALFTTSHLSRNLHHECSLVNNVESEFEKLFKSKQLPVHLIEVKKPLNCNGNGPVL